MKPTYEDLINVAVSNELQIGKFPNRDAKFLREGSVLSQLDGEGMRQMEKQQGQASKEAYNKKHLLKEIAKNTGANIHDLINDSHQELRTDRTNQALNPNAQFYNLARSDQDMKPLRSLPPSLRSLPPSGEIEIRDNMSDRTIPRSETTYLPSLGRSQAMSDDVANQSTAVADRTKEVERQKQIAEYGRQQQETRQFRRLETVRQEAAPVLQSTTQELTESHRNEAIAYVANLTENALNKLNKQSQEIQQMASNDERTRQMITARKNQLRNQEKEQETPKRANPKAKSEPFKFDKHMGIKDENDGENPETTHEPKGKGEDHRMLEKQNVKEKPTMTPKRI